MPDLFGQLDARESAAQHAGPWHFLRVAVERGLDQGGRSDGLTYKSREPVGIGRRVEVPLGRGDKAAAGIVIAAGDESLCDSLPPSKVKPIVRDTGAGLPPDLVELARWMASYYVCPLGMVLSTMLPAAVKKRAGLRSVVHLDRAEPAAEAALLEMKLPRQTRAAWEAIVGLGRSAFPQTPDRIAAQIGVGTLAPINRLVKLGLLRTLEIDDVRAFGAFSGQLGIEQADPSGASTALPGARPALTGQQSVVVSGITDSLGSFRVHLLRGVTGSGKTEVYLRVLERVIASGKSALVLVPEISLTPQTAGRFVERFHAAGVAVLHSGLSATQRHRDWARAASGAARVVVGARSAVFAPLDRLGLVVVDEEHASDYKQDQLPRYHGRDVAIKRAHMEHCPVILGSATPSLETWVNATAAVTTPAGLTLPADAKPAPTAKYTLWELTQRIGGATLPRVEIVDLREERRIREHQQRTATGQRVTHPHLHLLGPTLEAAIGQTLHAGGQILLLLNRRGYASYIACPDVTCGWVMTCDDCDAKMVQHRVVAGSHVPRGMVRCHHCLAQQLLPDVCPVCAKRTITLGLGTQRIEEELARKFGHMLGGAPEPPTTPPAQPAEWTTPPGLLRVDGDTMDSARDFFSALDRFARREVKILVGTQMIAKGLDFPNVRLVGVINADTALSLPDFRAAERTFQLVSQVAGRAGRGSIPGRVIVQTLDPAAPAITFAAAHDFTGFAAQELDSRRIAGLPPLSRMARIVLRDQDLTRAQTAADSLAAAIQSAAAHHPGGSSLRVIGPMPCPIARIAGHHRIALELLSPGRMIIQEVLAAVRAKGLVKSDAHTAVDIDPIALT